MGGFVQLGYRAENRKLVIEQKEAATVRMIFERFAKTGSATAQKKGTSFVVGAGVNGRGGGIGFDNQEFMDSALGKATVMALDQITGNQVRIALGYGPAP